MGLEAATKEVAKDVGVTLVNASDAPVIGLTSTDVTVEYRKNGDTTFTTKALLAGEFTEVGDGIYLVTFTATELNRAGLFRIKIDGSSIEPHIRDLQVIDELLSINQQIVDLKAGLAKLVNTRDAELLFNQLELRQQQLDRRIKDAERRIKVLQGQLSALRGT